MGAFGVAFTAVALVLVGCESSRPGGPPVDRPPLRPAPSAATLAWEASAGPLVSAGDLPAPPTWVEQQRWGLDISVELQLPFSEGTVQPFWLSAAQAAQPGATLALDGGHGPLQVLLNGAPVGLHPGDLAPSRLDVAGRLRAGNNVVALQAAPTSDEVQLTAGGTMLPERPPRVALLLAPEVRIDEILPAPSLSPGTFAVTLTTHHAPPGASAVVELLLDGASLARGAAALEADRAEVAVSLPPSLRWEAWDTPPPVVQCLAQLQDRAGRLLDRRRVRCALGSSALVEGRLEIDGRPVHPLAVKASAVGLDARAVLGRLWPRLHRAGVNSIETHGWVPDRALVDAAEELGIGLVVLPRCPGAIPRDLSERLQDDVEGEALRPWLARTVPWLEQSPVVLLWEREKDWQPVPGARRPVASGGAPPEGEHPVFVAGVRYSDTISIFNDPNLPGTWIIEMIPEDGPHPPTTPPGVVNDFARAWVVHQLGLVLPNPYSSQGLLELADEELDALGSGLAGAALGAGRRRGPASVHVSVTREGRPCWGAPVLLEVEGLPPQAAATGSDGVARLELFWQGPARVRLGELQETVELSAGSYGAEGWQPIVQQVCWTLP